MSQSLKQASAYKLSQYTQKSITDECLSKTQHTASQWSTVHSQEGMDFWNMLYAWKLVRWKKSHTIQTIPNEKIHGDKKQAGCCQRLRDKYLMGTWFSSEAKKMLIKLIKLHSTKDIQLILCRLLSKNNPTWISAQFFKKTSGICWIGNFKIFISVVITEDSH